MGLLGKPCVLVVDDEPYLREMLEMGLSRYGFDVVSAADGSAALGLMESLLPDVIVLDVMLPKVDGTSLLPMLRRRTEAPIVMLSARNDAPDKIAALTAGADDYVGKPFDLGELAARLQSHLRRPQLVKRDTIAYADVVMDTSTRQAVRSGVPLALTAREFDLLATLLREPGRVFTREQLIDRVWGHEAAVEPNVVETYISYLRGKLHTKGTPQLIRTIRYVGYTARID